MLNRRVPPLNLFGVAGRRQCEAGSGRRSADAGCRPDLEVVALDPKTFGVAGECQSEARPACCSVVVGCRRVLDVRRRTQTFLELLGSGSVRLDLTAAQV